MTSTFNDERNSPRVKGRVVEFSGYDIEEAARLLRLIVNGRETVFWESHAPGAAPRTITRDVLITAARQELTERRSRTEILGEGMFAEPAWETLLELYIEQQGTRFNIARLTSRLGLPPTTVLRWFTHLEDKQLVCRHANPTDQRAAFVSLTTRGIEGLDTYFLRKLTQSG